MMMELFVVEPMSVKFAVRKSVSMKFAVVKPAVGKSSKSSVKSGRPTVEPATRKSANPTAGNSGKPAVKSASPRMGPAAVKHSAPMTSTAVMRSSARGTELEKYSGHQEGN
jgi:hypothetical protein